MWGFVCVCCGFFLVVFKKKKAEDINFSNNFVMMTQVCAKISSSNTKVNIHLTTFRKPTTGFCQSFRVFFFS